MSRHENGVYDGTVSECEFCVKLQKSPSETLEMLKIVYGESPGESNHGYQSPTMLIWFFKIRGIIYVL
jgi:hypothetical protein